MGPPSEQPPRQAWGYLSEQPSEKGASHPSGRTPVEGWEENVVGDLAGEHTGAQDAPSETYGEADFDWSLRTLAGEDLTLEEMRGRVLFINMWATWCRPCVLELGGIQALSESLEGSGVTFLLVSPEDPEHVARFLEIHDLDVPAYVEAQEMPPAFGLRALPTTYVVDREGRIVLRHRGAAEWNREEVRDFLLALSAPGPP